MNQSSLSNDPTYINANRPVAFRAYRADDSFFDTARSVADIEKHLADQGRRLFVERIRTAADKKISDPTTSPPSSTKGMRLCSPDAVSLS